LSGLLQLTLFAGEQCLLRIAKLLQRTDGLLTLDQDLLAFDLLCVQLGSLGGQVLQLAGQDVLIALGVEKLVDRDIAHQPLGFFLFDHLKILFDFASPLIDDADGPSDFVQGSGRFVALSLAKFQDHSQSERSGHEALGIRLALAASC
jgi:hypothetical protein